MGDCRTGDCGYESAVLSTVIACMVIGLDSVALLIAIIVFVSDSPLLSSFERPGGSLPTYQPSTSSTYNRLGFSGTFYDLYLLWSTFCTYLNNVAAFTSGVQADGQVGQLSRHDDTMGWGMYGY